MPTLSTPTKIAGFGAALAVTFGAAVGLGALVDPTDGAPRAAAHGAMDAASGSDGKGGAGHAASTGHAASSEPAGLSSVQDGYRVVPERTRAVAGRAGVLRFRIEGRDGRPVRSGYELESERELHLIVVRRDGTGFQHLHPRRAADGTWSTPLTLAAGGSHRVLADFVVGGTRRTLGVDLEVPGDYRPAPPAAPVRTAAVDGYRVTLDGAPRAGREATLRFRVTRGGRPVAGLQPYLGARGHLVALREGDLAYLHVHPTEGDGHGGAGAPSDGGHRTAPDRPTGTHDDAGSAPHGRGDAAGSGAAAGRGSGTSTAAAADGTVAFAATFPAAGRHRLWFQFRTGGVVRTAPFVVEVAR